MMSQLSYLQGIWNLVSQNESNIRLFIGEFPKMYFSSESQQPLLFGVIDNELDRTILASLFTIIVDKLGKFSNRDRKPFTSMLDTIQQVLALILEDALRLEKRAESVSRLLRKIIHLGIGPKLQMPISDDLMLNMDLGSYFKVAPSSECLDGILEADVFRDELDIKTLKLYFATFNDCRFYKFLSQSSYSGTEFYSLFFEKYFSSSELDYIIRHHQITLHLLENLRSINASQWHELNDSTVLALIQGTMKVMTNPKHYSLVFDVFAKIAEYSNDHMRRSLVDFGESVDVTSLSDTAFSKYWCFIGSLCLLPNNLDEAILFTLQRESFLKSKISVCRVISTCFSDLCIQGQIPDLLMDCFELYESNKLRWNVITCFNSLIIRDFPLSRMLTDRLKRFLMSEMRKFGNFKVISSLTELFMNWSSKEGQSVFTAEDFEVIWDFAHKMDRFLAENCGSFECDAEDDGQESTPLTVIGTRLSQRLTLMMGAFDWSNTSV